MPAGTQRLQPLLVRDAAVLLFVNDDKAKVLELHLFREHGVGADHDIDLAGR